jgi:hypothetical protein
MFSAGAIWLPAFLHHKQSDFVTKASNLDVGKTNISTAISTANLSYTALTAREAATMYARYEQMRNGTCQFPEAIQIPDKDKAVYLENVVGGKIPTNLYDLAVANSYLEKVRCNYTPMLMANSK